jgi:protein-arginine deiminase
MLQAEVDRGNGGVQMFIGKNWYDQNFRASPAVTTIAQLLQNTDVMSRSASAAAEVDAQLEILKRETGLTEAEIIRVPFLHHTEYGAAIAHQPGFVNGFVAGLSDFVAPDPFGPVIGGKDIFKKDFEEKLTAIGYNVRWIDDWDLYHVNMGEVHCGTNAARKIPETKWWEGGR